jgi:imidazolonepropionase-like amidohydrolase
LLGATSVGAQLKAVRFAAVVDGSGTVTQRGVVIISGDTILRVARPTDPIPPGAQVIDMSRYTAIPGMIDVHTHMTYYWDSTSGTDPWRQPPRARRTDRAARTLERDANARDRSHDRSRSGRIELHRHRAAAIRSTRQAGSARACSSPASVSSARDLPIVPTPTRRARSAAASMTFLK